MTEPDRGRKGGIVLEKTYQFLLWLIPAGPRAVVMSETGRPRLAGESRDGGGFFAPGDL